MLKTELSDESKSTSDDNRANKTSDGGPEGHPRSRLPLKRSSSAGCREGRENGWVERERERERAKENGV